MSSRILLIRHGRSAQARTRGRVDAASYHDWRRTYDEAPIASDDVPPPHLCAAVCAATTVAASDLPRAITSAGRLAPGRSIEISPDLRETVFPPPQLPIRLPVLAWDAVVHLYELYRTSRGNGATADEIRRAAGAAEWLTRRAQDSACIAVVTHGFFRRYLARALEERGWSPATTWRRYRCWSVWSFLRP